MNGLKLEIGNWEKIKQVYELDVYRLAEELSESNATGYKKTRLSIEYVHQQYKSMKAKLLFSNFNIPEELSL